MPISPSVVRATTMSASPLHTSRSTETSSTCIPTDSSVVLALQASYRARCSALEAGAQVRGRSHDLLRACRRQPLGPLDEEGAAQVEVPQRPWDEPCVEV